MAPIIDSVREIDGRHWLIDSALLLIHDTLPGSPHHALWSDGKGGYFILRDAPQPLPPTKPLHPLSEIQRVHEGGTVSAVWQAGEAFIKAKHISLPEATREHVTLDYLHRQPVDFNIPTVHFHAEVRGRYYIVLSKLHGQTLAEMWPSIDEATKQVFVDRIVTICTSLATWTGDKISGVDGHHLSELFLTKQNSDDCSHQSLFRNCQEQRMDCSSLVFYHCDLGPGNIIISPEGLVGIIDWETAGFVPEEWVRTKFRISSGMDIPLEDEKARTDWRKRVAQGLGLSGFQDVADGWMSWWCS